MKAFIFFLGLFVGTGGRNDPDGEVLDFAGTGGRNDPDGEVLD